MYVYASKWVSSLINVHITKARVYNKCTRKIMLLVVIFINISIH